MAFLFKGRWILTTVILIGAVSLTGCGISALPNNLTNASTALSKGTVSESKELTAADMKIGKLFIGESLANVRQEFGKPAITTIVHGNGAPQLEYTGRGFTVGGDPVFIIDVSSRDLGGTTRGIQIGSKEQDVRQAYPNARWVQNNTQLFDESGDKKYSITFFISQDSVNRMILTDEVP